MDEVIHCFDSGVAAEVGVSAAILLHHIVYWCKRNKEADKNFRDGRYWMYDTQAKIAKSFPYMSLVTVKRALSALVQADWILVGNFNRVSFDNTCWYTPSDKALALYAKCAIPLYQNDTDRQCQNDTDNTTSNTTHNIPPLIPPQEEERIYQPPATPKGNADNVLFDKFWTAYPRKTGKDTAIKAWKKLKVDAAFYERIMDALRRAIQFDHRFRDKTYTPYPATWLNSKPWEEEFALPPAPSPQGNSAAFEELKRIAAEPGVPPPEPKWR